IVVDLAIENDPRTAIGIVDWLLPALQVDDGEAAHRHPNGSVDIKTVFVRPAMTNVVVHARQQLLVNCFPVVSNDAYDSTHDNNSGLPRPSPVLGLLLQQNKTDGDKNEIENQQLSALAISRADVSLEDRISDGKHRGENQNGRDLA